MQTMRESWTDERLDDLNGRVGDGFRQVDDQFRQMDQRFEQVDQRFEQVDQRFNRVEDQVKDLRGEVNSHLVRIDGRLDSIQRMIAFGAITLSSSFVAGFVLLALRV